MVRKITIFLSLCIIGSGIQASMSLSKSELNNSLCSACSDGDLPKAISLLALGAQAENSNTGHVPLFYAAAAGKIACMKLLVSHVQA